MSRGPLVEDRVHLGYPEAALCECPLLADRACPARVPVRADTGRWPSGRYAFPSLELPVVRARAVFIGR